MSKRRPSLASPLTEARKTALRLAARPFQSFSSGTRFALGFALFAVVTTLLLANTFMPATLEDYKVGEVVRRPIVAPNDIGGFDINDTEKHREAARESVRPVFKFDPTRSETAVQTFRSVWDDAQKKTAKGHFADKGNNGTTLLGEAATRENFARDLSVNDFDKLQRLLRESSEGYIYDDSEAVHLKQEVTLVDVLAPHAQSSMTLPRSKMLSLSAARQSLRSRLSQLGALTTEQQSAIAAILLPLLRPSVTFDIEATRNAQEAAVNAIPLTVISLKHNQVVAREGDRVTETTLAQFNAIRANTRVERPWHHLFGLLFIVTALYWAAWKFIEHRSTTFSLSLTKRKAFVLVAASVVVQTLLMRIGYTVADSLATQSMRAPLNDPTLWDFAIPFAAGALLVALLVDTQLALITALLTAFFAGLLAPSGVLNSFYAVVSCSAAIYGIGRYRERQSVTLAGVIVGGVNALMAVALIAYAQQALTLRTILVAMGCGIISGLLTTIFTAGGLPVNESLFGILTDVKLLELSNADLPVLGQLALRAPGTNQHSHAVGQLAEEACRAVGANPLLARIGALYHDIGKLAAPEYFVENQQGNNPHDRLRPSQSARIITSHVTYGLKLAKEIGLPTQISDFIPQHHGTRTLHYFLRKAQSLACENETVDEADFRYPGPKPRFKETAIMMLADSCEAAARSLARPDPESIRIIVTKIIDAVISDKQLDECDLTLREINTIRETMITSLTAIYHARIDYPGFNPPSLTDALKTLPAPEIDSEERGVSYSKPSDIPIDKGGEVEDEAMPRAMTSKK
jgi:putative nucleotidyltransferase with HDIG domain